MVADKKDGTRDDRSARAKAAAAASPSAASEAVIVDALRSAYRETVEEEIPADFMDLLGKLS